MPTASKFAFENNNYNSFFYIDTEYSIKYGKFVIVYF